jgi:hypothetical protein
MLTCTAGPHSVEDFGTGFPRKIQIDNEEIRARLLACVNLIEKNLRLLTIRYNENFTRHFMLLQRFDHEFDIRSIILNQQNPSKRRCGYRLSLVLRLEV